MREAKLTDERAAKLLEDRVLSFLATIG